MNNLMDLHLMTLNEFNNLSEDDKATYFYGAIAKTIFSFNGNKEIPSFLKNTFNIEFKEYVFRAKPLIISRTVKIFFNDVNVNFKENYEKLLQYTSPINKPNSVKVSNKKRNANDSLEKWFKGI